MSAGLWQFHTNQAGLFPVLKRPHYGIKLLEWPFPLGAPCHDPSRRQHHLCVCPHSIGRHVAGCHTQRNPYITFRLGHIFTVWKLTQRLKKRKDEILSNNEWDHITAGLNLYLRQ